MNREGIYGDSLKQALAKVDRIEAVRTKVLEAGRALRSLDADIGDELRDEIGALDEALSGLSYYADKARDEVDALRPHFPNAAE